MKPASVQFAAGALMLLIATMALGQQQQGKILGQVVDESGKPVIGATVSAESMGVPLSSAVPQATTDRVGHFEIGSLPFGSYKVFARKESEDYPDTSFAFYSNHVFPTVTLFAHAPSATLTLRVGPRAGILTGTVTDALTRKPVGSTFLLRRAADFGDWISTSQRSEYRVLLPPESDIVLEISAPGYKTFYYGGESDPLRRPPIHLKSQGEMKLDIQLEPIAAEQSNK